MGRGKTASSRFADDERDVFLEDYNTRYLPISGPYYLLTHFDFGLVWVLRIRMRLI